jgi:hypothetical protein
MAKTTARASPRPANAARASICLTATDVKAESPLADHPWRRPSRVARKMDWVLQKATELGVSCIAHCLDRAHRSTPGCRTLGSAHAALARRGRQRLRTVRARHPARPRRTATLGAISRQSAKILTRTAAGAGSARRPASGHLARRHLALPGDRSRRRAVGS